jgi:hypothetical protein
VVTQLPPRQKYSLVAFGVLGLVTAASGAWEFRLSGAVHELVLGAVMLLLVGLAHVLWTRPPRRSKGQP